MLTAAGEKLPDYGSVWEPSESEDWAPYRDGNWVWEPDYGWTWVGNESWGWAPITTAAGCITTPRGMVAWTVGLGYRPLWAPAYVSFFGFGGGVGFGVGYGYGGWAAFGWLPIGPCDTFFPWWGGYGDRLER